MKKLFATLCVVAMLATMFSFTTLASGAEGGDLVVSGVCVAGGVEADMDMTTSGSKGAYDFIALTNASENDINLYDGYAIGYAGATTDKLFYLKRVKEITYITAGTDWVEYSGITNAPANPETAVVASGATVLLWGYNDVSDAADATFADFRNYWGLADDVLVVAFDASEEGNGTNNFHIKQKSTAEYVLINLRAENKTLSDDVIAAMGSEDKTGNDDSYTFDDRVEVVCYLVVDFDDKAADGGTVGALKAVQADCANKIYTVSSLSGSTKGYEAVPTYTSISQMGLAADENGGSDNTGNDNTGSAIDPAGDVNIAPLYAVLVLGIAVVAIASRKRIAR